MSTVTFSGSGELTQSIVNANPVNFALYSPSRTIINYSPAYTNNDTFSFNWSDTTFNSIDGGLTYTSLSIGLLSPPPNYNNIIGITIGNIVQNISNYIFPCPKLVNIYTYAYISNFGLAFFGLNNAGLHVTFDYTGAIPDSACIGRTLMTGATIGPNITSIGAVAFYNTNSLLSIIIPDSVTSIGNQAFQYSSLSKVYISDTTANRLNPQWHSPAERITGFYGAGTVEFLDTPPFYTLLTYSTDQGVSFNWSGVTFTQRGTSYKYIGSPTALTTQVPNYANLTNVIIGNVVLSIGNNTFRGCSTLTSIEITDSVSSIGNQAFQGCYTLTSIQIPNSVTSIDDYAFQGCAALTAIEIPDSVTSIGYQAFQSCAALLTVYISNVEAKVLGFVDGSPQTGVSSFFGTPNPVNFALYSPSRTIINYSPAYTNNDTFSFNWSGTTFNSIDGGLTYTSLSIGLLSQPPNNNNIIGVTIGKIVKNISNYIFPCPKLVNIYTYAYIPNFGLAFFGLNNAGLHITFDYTGAIPDSACNGRTLMTDLTIGPNITSIGAVAFYNTNSLLSIIIPDSVTSIGNQAFQYCTSLKSVIIGNSVTSIGSSAFNICVNLKTVTISLETANTLNIAVPASNVKFFGAIVTTVLPQVTFRGTGALTQAIVTAGIGSASTIIIEGYNSISENAFYNKTQVTSVTISNSVLSIGNAAFQSCTKLSLVTIPNSVTNIGNNAFQNCFALTLVTIPNSVTSIGNAVFQSCSKLSFVIIPDSVISIGSSAFQDCSVLTFVTFGTSVTSIGSNAFNGCFGLSSVEFPVSVTSIGNNAFQNCISLTSITGGISITTIGSSAFQDCLGFTSVTIPNSVIFLSDNVFQGCSRLISATIPNSVTTIGNAAFANCTSLQNVILTQNSLLTSIGNNTFQDCVNLKSIIIPSLVTNISNNMFNGCVSLESINIPSSVTSISEDAFVGCSGLINITVNTQISNFSSVFSKVNNPGLQINFNYVGSIQDSTCNNFTNLQRITISFSITSIGSTAFNGCSSLSSVTIPSSVTSIGDSAFQQCTSLASVTLRQSALLTSIGSTVFNGCSSLTSMSIPTLVNSIGTNTFQNCSNLEKVYLPSGNALNILSSSTSQDFYGKIVNIYVVKNPTVGPLIIPNQIISNTSFIITNPITDSDGIWSYTSTNTNIATILGNTITFVTIGNVTINGNLSSTDEFYSATTQTLFNITDAEVASTFPFISTTTVTENIPVAEITQTGTTVEIPVLSPEQIAILNPPSDNDSERTSNTNLFVESLQNLYPDANNIVIPASLVFSPVYDENITNIVAINTNDSSVLAPVIFESNNLNSETGFYSAFSGVGQAFQMQNSDGSTTNITNITETEYQITTTTATTITVETKNKGEEILSGGNVYMFGSVSAAVLPPPVAPYINSVSTTNGSAIINFTQEQSLNSGITGYLYSINNGFSWVGTTTTTSPITIQGLTNGQTYIFGLKAFNGLESVASNYVSATIQNNTKTFTGNGVLTQAIVNNELGTATIVIIKGYTSIQSNAFLNKSLITSITIVNSVISIGNSVFQGCSALISITIPSSVTSIGANAFSQCTQFRIVYLPSPNGLGKASPSSRPATFYGSPNQVNILLYVPPISNICFPAGTLITCNQGNIPIEQLNPNVHTIRNKKIVCVTNTRSVNDYLVCFEKHSLGNNIPSHKTVMTKDHAILFNGKMRTANEFLKESTGVYKVKYTGETLYNVLMEEHDKMMVNNLICETLNPENPMAKLFTLLQKYTPEQQALLIKEYNDFTIKSNNFSKKQLKNIM